MHTNQSFARTIALLAALLVTTAACAQTGNSPNTTSEKDLIAVLRSNAPAADIAITCKRLAIQGSSAAVPDLATLLPNAQLSSWARIALEAIPGKEADEALRNAAYSLEGKLLVGTINSIGVRRDASAVDLLTSRLQNKDTEVASAAAAALGRIGNAPAAKALRQSMAAAPVPVRSAIAEGCVLCAERLLAERKLAEASQIYDEVRKADVPKQRVLEATRGAILARNQEEGIQLLLEQFRSTDTGLFQIALSTAREFPGSAVDKALAAELAGTKPPRAALLIAAMADRKETVVLSAVLKAAEQGPKEVRTAALGALGRVGNDKCLSPLLKIALEDDQDLAQAAKAALAQLPSETINGQIATLLATAEGKSYPLLIEVVGLRRIDANSTLMKALDHSDPAVRSAALLALGETITLEQLPVLIGQAVSPKHSEDATVAQQALKAASVRMPDREACAGELVAAIERSSSVPTKSALLQILGAVGGTKALAVMGAAAKSTDPELQDVSTRLLGEWMTADAAPVLLELVKTAPGDKFQGRALRGYIRIARQFIMPEPQRAEMCQKAIDVARSPAEKKLVLDVLKRYPNLATLKLAIGVRQVPELKQDATDAALFVAQKINAKAPNAKVKELLTQAGIDQ